MKRQSLLILLLMCLGWVAKSQDILIYKNGDEVKAKVLEITTGEVKYKKWENQQGPIYTVLKSELFMIKYQNGEKDVFKDNPAPAQQPATTPTVPAQDVDAAVQKAFQEKERKQAYDENMRLYRKKLGKGIGLTAAGGTLFLTGMPLMAWGISSMIAYDNSAYDYYYYGSYDPWDSYLAGAFIGTAFTIASIPMLIIGPIQLGKAFRYKRMAKAGTSLAFEPMFRPTRNLMPANMASGYSTGVTFKLKF